MLSPPPLTSIGLIEALRQHELLPPLELQELFALARRSEARDLAREILRRNWLTPYQVNQILQGRLGDLLVGPYLVVERLDEGGQGQVFKARHRHMQRVVALKVLHKDALHDPEILGRFQRESKVIRQLNHPNIVQAHDAGPAGANFYLAMEYVEGTNLSDLVHKQGPLAPAHAGEYIRQSALGLQHIHERGLVHRDIKPSNLLLTRGGVIKILDLGLARRMHPVHGETTEKLTTDSSGALGTVDYMAPEQALDFHQADIRADVYSLGCTLYFLLTGMAPFGRATVAQKLIWHQHREPTPVEECRKDVPPGLLQTLRRMTAKNRSDRFQTPLEVVNALAGGRAIVPATPFPMAPVAVIVSDGTTSVVAQQRPPSGIRSAVTVPPPLPLAPAPPAARPKRAWLFAVPAAGVLGVLFLIALLLAWPSRKREAIVAGDPTLRNSDPSGKSPPADVPAAPDRVPLIDFAKGHLPNDIATDKPFFNLEDHPELGRALKAVYPATGDSFGDRAPRVTDWSPYTSLEFEAVNTEKEPRVLNLVVIHRNSTNFATRIRVPMPLKPGKNHVRIDLPVLANENGSLPDLTQVKKWYIHTDAGNICTVYVGNLWLTASDVIVQGKPLVSDTVIDAANPRMGRGTEGKGNEIKRNDKPSVFLVKFDLARYQHVLRNRTIAQAKVSFFVWDPSSNARSRVQAHPLLVPWAENAATWQQPSPGKRWSGPHFELGVDTGPPASYVVVLPDAPGTDSVDPPLEYQIDVTDVVHSWLSGRPNHGLAIASVSDRNIDQGLFTRFQIYASEHDRVQYGPKLSLRLK